MRQALGAGALGRPRGSGWRVRWEGVSGWGAHVNPWLLHSNVWLNSLQIKKKEKKKKLLALKCFYSLEFPGSPVIRSQCFHCWSLGSICGWGTKVPQAKWYSQKLKEKTFLFANYANKVKVIQSCPTLCDLMDCSPPDSSWNSTAKNSGVGSHSLLQGIFLTQGLNTGLLHFRQILYHLSH